MKVELKIRGRARSVEIGRCGGRMRFRLDGRDVAADALEVQQGIYSVLIGGESFEARIESTAGGLRVHVAGRKYPVEIADPRQWRRDRSGAAASEGRQQVVAPMPGKVVGVLVKIGDAVEASQGLLVIEAMKMQNEIKSPKTGTIERLTVSEGQTVNVGEVLAVIS